MTIYGLEDERGRHISVRVNVHNLAAVQQKRDELVQQTGKTVRIIRHVIKTEMIE